MIIAPMLALLTKFLAREAELVVISAKGKAVELSLIHISEPTRPY